MKTVEAIESASVNLKPPFGLSPSTSLRRALSKPCAPFLRQAQDSRENKLRANVQVGCSRLNNGITVRYKVEGSGPWVTLSHSLSFIEQPETFNRLVAAFLKG